MSQEMPTFEDFGSSQDLLKFIKDRADDIEGVFIPPGDGPAYLTFKGQVSGIVPPGAGMVIDMTDRRRIIS